MDRLRCTDIAGRTNHGFTIIEVVAVLVLIGILTAIAVGESRPGGTRESAVELEVVKAHLCYAQTLAMNSDSKYGIHFETGSCYWLFENTADESNMRDLPTVGGEYACDPPDRRICLPSLTITSAPQTIFFNTWGSPVDAGGNLVNHDTIITTSCNNIIITENTGLLL